MIAAGDYPGHIGGSSRLPLDPEHVFRPWRYTATRREHAASALGTKRGDFAIL